MPITHKFVSSITDVGGPTYVQPTHWNNDHNFPPMQLARIGNATWIEWTNMPSAITELQRAAVTATPMRFAYDFTYVNSVRLAVQMMGGSPAFASAALGLQWSEIDANVGSWWGLASGGTNAAWCGVGSGWPASAAARGVKIGTWYPVNPSARAAGWVNVRIVGFMGNSALDPGIGDVSVYVL